MVELLIAKNAKISQAKAEDVNALHLAAFCGHTGVCRALVNGGIDKNASMSNGKGAVQVAKEQGHFEVFFLIARIA